MFANGILTRGVTPQKERLDRAGLTPQGVFTDPCCCHNALYFFEGNADGTTRPVDPTITPGICGMCYGFEEIPTRAGWFLRLGTLRDAFRIALAEASVLSFRIFVSDLSLITDAHIELGSSSAVDREEKEWSFRDQLTVNGWNEVTLDFSAGTGELDLSRVCRWRMFLISDRPGTVTVAVDDLTITHAAENPLPAFANAGALMADPNRPGEAFVITLNAANAPYGADGTGREDAADAINRALCDCRTVYGGGTVYLPAGEYRIGTTLTVPSGVTLMGDYPGADRTPGQAETVLSVTTAQAAVRLSGSSGVEGLTFRYPDQRPTDIRETDYTIVGRSAVTVREVTLVNSYRGLSIEGAHGVVTVDGLRGTVLCQGISLVFGAEVDVIEHVDFSPRYWSERDPSVCEEDVRRWMRERSTSGYYTWGCEGTMVRDAAFDGFRYGMYFDHTQRPDHADTYAQFCDVRVTEAETAVWVLASYWDMGNQFAFSSLEGREFAVRNASAYPVKLASCRLLGQTEGLCEVTSAGVPALRPALAVRQPYAPTIQRLFNVRDFGADATGGQDAAPAVQAALCAAHEANGGYVYFPAGQYRIAQPLTVYENTCLLGANRSASQDSRGEEPFGSTLLVTYGKGGTADDPAAITLSGPRACVRDLRVVAIDNGLHSPTDPTVDFYSPVIACRSSGNDVRNIACYGVSRGVAVRNASDTVIYRLCGAFYHNAVTLCDSRGVCLDALLSNVAGQTTVNYRRFNPSWYNQLQTQLTVSRTQEIYLIARGSQEIRLTNTFAYQPKIYLQSTNSTVSFVNAYSSRMGAVNCMFELDGGSLSGVNTYLKDAWFFRLSPTHATRLRVYNNKGQILPSGETEADRTQN